ncbi:MAG TPA: hypothetical protein VNM92_15055 [Thermoanaerobaculia bacterium]|nr:hypothetical protein [Thermoanaerobaculia bacterium]
MVRIAAEVSPELVREIERIVRDGWFSSEEEVFMEALRQFVEAKSFLGDSPRMLHRFAADALNESKPDTALKFVSRAMTLIAGQPMKDLGLYQQLVELRVQILLILGRDAEALAGLEQAREHLPNSPAITKWLDRMRSRKPPG